MNKVVIIDAKRSPVGCIPGKLNYIEETLLLSKVFEAMNETLVRITVDEAITGSSFPIERDNLCRKVVQKFETLNNIPAYTLSKTCASSDEALRDAYFKIKTGEVRVILVGGCEKVSNSPYALHFIKHNVKKAIRNKLPLFTEISDTIQENDMAYINEMLSRKNHISRKQQDDFTINSINKAQYAESKGYFKREIVPIVYHVQDYNHCLERDEWLSNDRTEEKIRGALPLFLKDGMLTQYNTAPMCDCATAILLTNETHAIQQNMNILSVIKDAITIAVDPEERGQAMVRCVGRLIEKNKLKVSDIDLFEINESFASQAIYTIEQLKIKEGKVNVNGGNLALGYPIGATGLRMGVSLIYEMLRRNVRWGISVICSGGNMANATLFENPAK